MELRDDVVARSRSTVMVDEGLRSHMLKVYNYMASGLALTGIVAMMTVQSATLMYTLFSTGLYWVVFLAPVAMVFYLSARINHMTSSTAQIVFWVYAALMGLSLSSIFVVYTGESIARVFFITAGLFASMSIYGYTTRKDLTSWGSFLFMGLMGIVLASIVNLFMHSSAVSFGISLIGVFIFTGLTAYDTQKIKELYHEGDSHEVAGKKAVLGALNLYLDFINLFLMLLRLLGSRR